MARRPLTVIGFVGSTLDQGRRGPARWERWRPTVSLYQHQDLLVDRLVLLHGSRYEGLAKAVATDVAQVSPETAVQLEVMEIASVLGIHGVTAAAPILLEEVAAQRAT